MFKIGDKVFPSAGNEFFFNKDINKTYIIENLYKGNMATVKNIENNENIYLCSIFRLTKHSTKQKIRRKK